MTIETSATEQSAQDIESRVEESLFGKPEGGEPAEKKEPVIIDGKEVLDGEGILPDDNDSDLDDDDGSEDLGDIANEDLTLAEYLGIDDDKIITNEDGSYSFNAVIDGETKAVPLAELAKSFQLQGHVNNKSIALENERKKFDEQSTAVAEQLQVRVQGLDQLSKVMEGNLVKEYQSIDWDALRVQNPAEWTALRSEYAEKAQQLQQAQALIQEEGKRIFEEGQAKFDTQRTAHMQQEFAKMVEGNPTWSDKATLDKDMTDMRSFVTSQYGFNDEDMSLVTDHRLIQLIQDAQSYRKGKKTAESKKDKVVPKFQATGVSQAKSAQLTKARRVKANKAAVKKSGGHVRDIARSIEDRM